MKKNIIRGVGIGLLTLVALLNLSDLKQKISIPVKSGTKLNWDIESYWAYPWWVSVVHRGIDIFGELNTDIVSPVSGLVVNKGYSGNGGNYIYVLSPDLKFYYFAHLNKTKVNSFSFVKRNQVIGLMGDTGNARFAPFHLHFSIFSPIPIFRHLDFKAIKGWQKMFYPNPNNYLPISK